MQLLEYPDEGVGNSIIFIDSVEDHYSPFL